MKDNLTSGINSRDSNRLNNVTSYKSQQQALWLFMVLKNICFNRFRVELGKFSCRYSQLNHFRYLQLIQWWSVHLRYRPGSF